MNDYKPNVPKNGAVEKKKVEKVVTGQVKVKKKSGIVKLADIFLPGDVQDVKSYILVDVLIPAIKKAFYDIVTDGANMLIYGGTNKSKRPASNVSYRNFYDRRDDRGGTDNNRTRTGYSYDDITIESRAEADEVLSQMNELIELYGVVSVADLYDLVGKSHQYTDNKYGWTNINSAEPIRVRDGWMLKLPKALPIN